MSERLRWAPNQLREAKKCAGSFQRAFTGKISAFRTGESPVAPSCQIPGIRSKYAGLGLPAHSGYFVEIGGYDGEEFSNTSFLADQGWVGVYVEPVPAYCRRARIRHSLNRVRVEGRAVSTSVGTCELNLMGALSTNNPAALDAYLGIDWARGFAAAAKPLRVKTDTLANILFRHSVPADFELLVVDVEGSEETIVIQLLASPWRPQVIVIELCDTHPDFSAAAELHRSYRRVRENILASGYSQIFSDHINTIFRRDPGLKIAC